VLVVRVVQVQVVLRQQFEEILKRTTGNGRTDANSDAVEKDGADG
jgi:hypothetical protein